MNRHKLENPRDSKSQDNIKVHILLTILTKFLLLQKGSWSAEAPIIPRFLSSSGLDFERCSKTDDFPLIF